MMVAPRTHLWMILGGLLAVAVDAPSSSVLFLVWVVVVWGISRLNVPVRHPG